MAKAKHIEQEFLKRYFTIEEAERLLPEIEKILSRTIKLNKALELLESIEIEVYEDNYEELGKVTKANKQFHKLSYEFYDNIEKLEETDCLVQDLELGIVDFYCRFEGRDIFLCWKLGEKGIRFWHEIEAGYIGRKPIVDLARHK